MSELLKNTIKKQIPHFRKYGKYIKENPWNTLTGIEDDEGGGKKKYKSTVDVRLAEFTVQNQLVDAIITRLKVAVNKNAGDHHLKIFKDFVKETLKIISLHTERADDYISDSNISKIEDVDLRASEIAFHNVLFKAVSSIDDAVSALNIKEEQATEGIQFLNDTKAPLSMHKVLIKKYPTIQKKLDELDIDFDSPPKNEMHILNPNPPVWNTQKHYWEQEKITLQYYVDEFKKINSGINIDGYYMSDWMYYHLNVYVTPVPESIFNSNSGEYESKDVIKNPPLRDNEEILFSNYNLVKKNQVMMFVAATRRAAKTTLLASHLEHAATIGKQELLCAGGSAKDLGQIAKNFKISILNKNPAFAIYNVTNDWEKKIEIGMKSKDNKTIPLSTLNIVNLDSGTDKKSEVLAGYTPDVMILDEAMKAPFLSQLEALKPALNGATDPSTGKVSKRCYPIISGTGGNEELGKDALTMLNFPEANEILPMQWDLLERGVPEEAITWSEDKINKPFGTFIPGQMSVGMPKYESTLADYVGKPNAEGLRKIKINLTDWVKSKEIIEERRMAKFGNDLAYHKEVVYLPITISDIFMSGKISIFPIAEARAHKEYLLQTGLWDRRREIYRDSQGKIQISLTTKKLVVYPHKGGIVDAPALIFEDPPQDKPKFGTYTAGFDDVKQIDSATDSVTTFYVMKNKILGDPFSEKIVASISFRPDKKEKVYEQWLMLMELYNLEGTCFGENEDFTIKDYLDRRHLTDTYLADGLDFSKTFNLPNNLKRTKGWSPKASKKYLQNLFADYCNEEFEVETEDGEIITIKGVQRIDDIWLLEEIINWAEGKNCDRLTAIYGAYGFLSYLQSSQRWRIRTLEQQRKQAEPKKIVERTKDFYREPSRRSGFYRGNRR